LRELIRSVKLPENLSSDPYVSYTLKVPGQDGKLVDKTFSTDKLLGKFPEGDFRFEKIHIYDEITEDILCYILKNNV
jgi:hypothetical protein